MTPPWTVTFERDAVALVARVAETRALDAWRALMVMIAPRIEGWARRHRLLVRCRLVNADDARAVMVAVLERLAANDYDNLRRFATATSDVVVAEDDLVAQVVRLAKIDATDGDELDVDDTTETPLRAWLLRLVDFVARDHVRQRLGWSGDGGGTKRALHSDAVPLAAAGDPGARPPMTDRLTVAQLVDEILAYVATFPADMRGALALWMDDVAPAEIARTLALADADRARTLVRAAQARLRERFRGRSPVLFA